MKILCLSPFLWSGAGSAITRLNLELTRRGHHCEVVSSGQSRGLSDWDKYVSKLRRGGICYRQVDLFDRSPASVWKSICEISEMMIANDYDLIHVHSGVPALVAGIARDNTKKNIPIVATFHSWNSARPQWMNWSDIWALNRCDTIVADSGSYLEYLVDNGVDQNKAEVIHLGADLPRDIQQYGRKRAGAFRILSVGRIERRKDQETLVRAFAIFRQQVKRAVLDLVGPVGEDDYQRRLRQRSKLYGWDQGVRFTGMVRDIGKYYRRADLYVTTSLDEGFGLALLDAMAYGLPTLSTSVPGHRDFARDGINTVEIPTGDYHGIARKMIELYNDAERMKVLGRNARKTAECNFSWSNTVLRYTQLYKELLTRYHEDKCKYGVASQRGSCSLHIQHGRKVKEK